MQTGTGNRLWDDLHAFLEGFLGESDRSVAIVGAAKLDSQLRQLLSVTLIPVPTSTDDLLDQDRPIGAFGARIHLAHRLGLIDGQLTWALNLVRRIRNNCAHEPSTVSLCSGPHRDRVRELVRPFQVANTGTFESLRKGLKLDDLERSSSDFRLAISLISSRLQVAFEEVASISTERAIGLIPPGWTADRTEPKQLDTEATAD